MMLRNDTSAPIPPRQPSRAGAIVGRWLVILLFSGVVAGAVWQYRERQRISAELAAALLDKSEAETFLEFERSANRELKARLNELTEASLEMLSAVASADRLKRQIEPAASQYLHSSPAYVAAPARQIVHTRTPAPALRTPAPAPRVAQTYTPPPAPSIPVDRIQSALKTRIDRYYKAQRNTGSGSTLVFEIDAEYGEPREIPGWSGRYEVKGEVWYQYYDSIWGGSFSRGTGSFTAEVKVTGSRVEVVDFSAR